ncbi:restriction endonuclease subunit S [Brevundimonas sp.]|uniref:restriction endonuclease subunit S n=1 Tax=Brevundimonas sp. TaxID=1871086 RepID=UPI00261D0F3D|nr:restriction endonuclease subunit S [Brevundimonas sp.]
MFRSNIPPQHLPDGWRPAQLSEIATVHGGGRLKLNKSHYAEAGARAYSAAGPDGFVEQVEGEAPTIVLSSIGARCGKSFLTDGPWTTLANTQVITPRPALASAAFLHAILDDEDYWNRSGSAQPFIKPSDVKGAWVTLPPLDEQRRIAQVLRSMDEAISSAKSAHSKAEAVLSQSREVATGLSMEPPDWERRPLLDFFQLQRGHDLPVQDRKGGDVPVIASNGTVGFHNVSAATRPAVVTGRSGTIGKVNYFDGPCWPLNTTLYVKNFKGSCPRYVYHFLSAFPLADYATGTGVPTLNRNDVHVVEVPWPEVAEQRSIAAALDAIEETVRVAEREVLALIALKSSVADDLLTGRVRVPA